MATSDIVLVLVALVCIVLVSGCGASALQVNAEVAHAMLEAQSVSGPAIRTARAGEMRRAARAVHDQGGTEAAATAAAQEASRQWQCAVDGHRLYVTAVGTYIDTLVIWQAGRDFELADMIPFVSRALDTYRVLASCLGALGDETLPAVPSFLSLFPPAWDMGGS